MKPVCLVVIQGQQVRSDQLFAHKARQQQLYLRGLLLIGERADGAGVEDLALDGPAFEQLALLHAQLFSSCGQSGLDGWRHLDRFVLPGEHHVFEERRLPSLAAIAAPARPGSEHPSSSASSSISIVSSGSSRTLVALIPPQPGRSSSSSGRAVPITRIGFPRERSMTWSSRSRSISSAHCRSSMWKITGRSAASGLEQSPDLPQQLLPCRAPAGTQPLDDRSRGRCKRHQRFDHWPERDPFTVVQTATAQDRRLLADAREQLADEPRLPPPRHRAT